MINTILEIVQTGSTFTAFVLEPSSIKPEMVTSSTLADTAKHVAKTIFPDAQIVDAKIFAAEINTRVQQILGN